MYGFAICESGTVKAGEYDNSYLFLYITKRKYILCFVMYKVFMLNHSTLS
ncbi:hypothetical protein JPSP43_14830 [Staphylococcus pseudintermedius]